MRRSCGERMPSGFVLILRATRSKNSSNTPNRIRERSSIPPRASVPINQLGMEGFAAVKGISIKHIPTQGDAGAITAIIGGHVVAASGNAISYQPHADAGKIKCLAQFGGVRDKSFMPKIPTFKEMGIDVVADLWRWIVVPKGVAPERVKILAEAFQKALQDKETLSSLGKNPVPGFLYATRRICESDER